MQLKSTYFGAVCLEDSLKKLIAHYQPGRVLVVTGKQSFFSSPVPTILEKLFNDNKIEAIYFDDFDKNPKIEDVHKGIEKCLWSFELVLAIGGGSVLDIAKMINLFAIKENSLADYLAGKGGIVKKGKPFIAVPTTAGTGSEATHFSVLYINKEKFSVAHSYMLPTHAIIDPTLTYGLPAELTAVTAFDTFTQAIESYWAVNATLRSQQYASFAIKLCQDSLLRAVINQDALSRKKMALAAHFSGKAINISKTTAPHALSYELTMKYGIPHGHAVALTMPIFIKLNADFASRAVNETRGREYLQKTMSTLFSLLGCKNATECALNFKHLMTQAGLAYDLQSMGITSFDEITHIVNSVNLERMLNNPVKLEKSELLTLLQAN